MTYDSMMTYLSTLTPEQRDSLRGRSRFTPIQVIALSLRRASQLPEEIMREIMRHVMTIRRRTMNRRIRTGPPDGADDDRMNTGPSWVDGLDQTWLWGNTNWSRHYRGWSGTSRQRRRAWQVKVITGTREWLRGSKRSIL